MKVVAFNGSPRKKGGIQLGCLNTVFEELNKAGIETEMILVGKNKIRGLYGLLYLSQRAKRKMRL